MKTCNNCRAVYADEYGGQCHDCGAPMGAVQGSTGGDLAFAYANQLAQARKEDAFEQSVRGSRGNARPGDAFDRAPVHERVMQVARDFVIVPPEAQDAA